MSEPDLGFVEGGKETPSDWKSDHPQLNARAEYTHTVEDGLTQVARGGIQCALDGGSLQIAMYDVTDGVVGAQRVFRQAVTLPERPLDGEDGYEVDTHVFDLAPVELNEYVGRELVVAVRHDSSRPVGRNWTNPSDANISLGESGDPLPETWQHDLRDQGTTRSAALFVEPVEIPDGKDRTVLGSEVADDRSRTVLAAFSGLSPENGMVIEYDEQTGAGASVAVREDGTLDISQGADATDSLEVRIRDTDDTWHGPRDVTLDGKLGPVTLSATGDTASADGSTATLSLEAEGVDRITVETLWTDWTVAVPDADGASTDNRVADEGELELEWTNAQSVVRPSIAITPPAETYRGNGFYVVDVVAEGNGDPVTDTARLEIGGEFGFSAEDGISAAGAFSDGNRITIQDDQSRFGTKSTQAPHMFDRQSDGQLVNGTPEDAYADLEAGDFVPIGIDEGYLFDQRSGDMRLGDPRGESPPSPDRSGWYYAEPNETDEKDNWLSKVVGWPDHEDEEPPKPRRQVYISWLMRTNWDLYSGEPYDIDGDLNGSAIGGAAKVHRVWSDEGSGDGYRFSWTRKVAEVNMEGDGDDENVDPDTSWVGLSWDDFQRWHRLEIEVDYREDGYTRCYVDGELLHEITILDTYSEWVGSISPRLWGYNPSVPDWERPGMVLELADYYVDSSLARVVLTNAESWENADRRVTQPHFSWAEGELEFELYEGVLADEDTVHLWVVDENGDSTRVGTLSRKSAADSRGELR